MMNDDFYAIFGISPNSDQKTIQNAYWRLAKLNHPDLGGDAEFFAKITQIYTVLTDPLLKKHYDLTGRHVEEEVTKRNTAVLAMLAELLETALEATKTPPEQTDIMRMMRAQLREVREKYRDQLSRHARTIELLRFIRGKIKRKGAGRNVFNEVIDGRVRVMVDDYERAADELRTIEMSMDILTNHESIVDVARGLWGGFFGETAADDDGGTNSPLTKRLDSR